MPFPVDIAFVRRAESLLGVELPASYVAALQIENGGSVEASGDSWELHPIRDDSDTVRLKRTCSDVVHETNEARDWDGFPIDGVSIAANGSGDHLILLPDGSHTTRLGETVYEWSHETGELARVADSFARLRGDEAPTRR